MPKISKDLKDTVESHPHIKEIHFTKNGDHFFNVHELKAKGKGTGKFYGRLDLKPVVAQVIGDRKVYKNESVAIPSMLITETLTREQVLNGTVSEEGKEGNGAPEKIESTPPVVAKAIEVIERISAATTEKEVDNIVNGDTRKSVVAAAEAKKAELSAE